MTDKKLAIARRAAIVRQCLSPEVRRAQLLDVAERVFGQFGYQGTTIEDIATAAGVARDALFSEFRDKDALYLECVRRARTEFEVAFTQAALSQPEAQDRVEAGLTAYFRFVQERGWSWDILFGVGAAVAGTVAAEVAALRFATAERVSLILRAVQPHLSPQEASAYAHVVSGAAEQLAKWWRANQQVPLQQIVALQMNVVWHGLVAQTDPGAVPPSIGR